MTAVGADEPRPLTPLEMAQNCAAAVGRYAEHGVRDPLGSFVARSGDRGHASAQLAANLALVSIAEDLHRLLGILTAPDYSALREWVRTGRVRFANDPPEATP